MTISTKQEAKRSINVINNLIMKSYGQDAGNIENRNINVSLVSTGSAAIDDATGIGGLPRGRLVEIYGPEGSGKSSFCYSVIAQAQKAYPDKYVLYIDGEHAVNLEYMAAFGVDTNPDSLLFYQPSSAEEALEICDKYAASGACSVIIYDSVVIPTISQLKKGMNEETMADLARAMSKAVPQITISAHDSDTLIVFVNQIRSKVGFVMGSPLSVPGGNALKFAASIRLDIRQSDKITDASKKIIGAEVKLKFIKNKMGQPFQEVSTKIIFGKGFDFEFEYIDIAVKYDVINKGGAWLSWESSEGETIKLQGQPNAAAFLKQNPKELEYLIQCINEAKTVFSPITIEEEDSIDE